MFRRLQVILKYLFTGQGEQYFTVTNRKLTPEQIEKFSAVFESMDTTFEKMEDFFGSLN